MRYFGLLLIPLLVVSVFAGPGCQRAQDEPKVQVEQPAGETPEAQMEEKVPAAMEGAKVPVMEEGEKAVKEVETEAKKEGSGLLKQLQEKGEAEIEKKIDE